MMETSESIDKLAAALSKAQGELKSAIKTATNAAFARGTNPGSKYATLADCAEAAYPTLAKHELAMIQGLDGTEFVARLVHASGQWVQIRVPIPGDLSKMNIQQLVACNTYLRRATFSLVGLVSDEDDDGNEASQAGAMKAAHDPRGDVSRVDPKAAQAAANRMLDAVELDADEDARAIAVMDVHDALKGDNELYTVAADLAATKIKAFKSAWKSYLKRGKELDQGMAANGRAA